jgi:hypothetical protein
VNVAAADGGRLPVRALQSYSAITADGQLTARGTPRVDTLGAILRRSRRVRESREVRFSAAGRAPFRRSDRPPLAKFAGGLVTLILAPVAVALISNALSGDNSNTDAAIELGPDLRADKFVVRNPEYDTVKPRPSSVASSSPCSSKRRRRCHEWS